MKTATEMIVQKLRDTFDQNGDVFTDSDSVGNVWLMIAAIVPYEEIKDKEVILSIEVQHPVALSSESIPTHVARVVVRTTDTQQGTNDYVDGSDFFFVADVGNQTTEFIWENESFGDAPKFHGGDIPSAIMWVNAIAEPSYVQFKDPFLTLEQRFALNGHDEDYILPVNHA